MLSFELPGTSNKETALVAGIVQLIGSRVHLLQIDHIEISIVSSLNLPRQILPKLLILILELIQGIDRVSEALNMH